MCTLMLLLWAMNILALSLSLSLSRSYVQAVRVLIVDELHLLGDERGQVLEVILSRTNFIASHTHQTVRVVGLCTALANAKDLADWLGVKQVWKPYNSICIK